MLKIEKINDRSVSESLKMPPKKAGGRPKKTASGYRMPDHLDPGTVLTDLYKKQVGCLSPLASLASLLTIITICSLVDPGQDGRHRRGRGDLPRHRGREGGTEGGED